MGSATDNAETHKEAPRYRRFLRCVADEDYVNGETNIGLPYIYIDTERELKSVLEKANSTELSESDRQILYTLFHEFIHVIQLLVCPACHLVEMSVLWELFDANQAAWLKKASGVSVIGEIPSSADGTCFAKIEKEVFEETADGEIKVGNLIEGIARTLEEKFRGDIVDDSETLYTKARLFTKSRCSEHPLCDEEFLDVCEVALRMTSPASAFVSLVKYVNEHQEMRGSDFFAQLFFAALRLGFGLVGDMADSVAQSNRAVFNNPILKGYCDQYEIMLKAVRSHYGAGPVFSRIYSRLNEAEKTGLPLVLKELIAECGSPIIFSKSGEIVQWGGGDTDEHREVALGIDAVYSQLYERKSMGTRCKLIAWCNGNRQADGSKMPVDGSCDCNPCGKQLPGGSLCPFLKVWKALGFEGLEP